MTPSTLRNAFSAPRDAPRHFQVRTRFAAINRRSIPGTLAVRFADLRPYAQKSFDVSAFKGQTIQVFLVGSEDSSLQTSFVVDDFALNVQ